MMNDNDKLILNLLVAGYAMQAICIFILFVRSV